MTLRDTLRWLLVTARVPRRVRAGALLHHLHGRFRIWAALPGDVFEHFQLDVLVLVLEVRAERMTVALVTGQLVWLANRRPPAAYVLLVEPVSIRRDDPWWTGVSSATDSPRTERCRQLVAMGERQRVRVVQPGTFWL